MATLRMVGPDYLEQLCEDFELDVRREYRAFDDTYVYYFYDRTTKRFVSRWAVSHAAMSNITHKQWVKEAEARVEEAIKAAAQLTKRRD